LTYRPFLKEHGWIEHGKLAYGVFRAMDKAVKRATHSG
jgi:hypothetical protein